MRLLGLSGYARSGKDAAAEALKYYGVERRAFADKLREFLYRLNPVVETGHERLYDFDKRHIRLTEVIDEHGWDGYKQTHWGDEIRQLLQRLGTECGRQVISDDIWVNLALKGMESTKDYVITDVRFPNEAQAIVDFGGEIWRIRRPGVTAVNAHPSETSLDYWAFDKYIDNKGTLEEFQTKIRDLYWSGVSKHDEPQARY